MARLPTIRSEMQQGHSLTAIYARHQAALKIGYQSFCKLVARYAEDAKLSPQRPSRRAEAPPPIPPKPSPAPPRQPPSGNSPSVPAPGAPAHARYEPTRPRTFVYDGNPRQDDEERLIGKPKPRTDK